MTEVTAQYQIGKNRGKRLHLVENMTRAAWNTARCGGAVATYGQVWDETVHGAETCKKCWKGGTSFHSQNQPRPCNVCGRTFADSTRMDSGDGVCPQCYEIAGYENAHQDGEHNGQPEADCPMCVAALLAETVLAPVVLSAEDEGAIMDRVVEEAAAVAAPARSTRNRSKSEKPAAPVTAPRPGRCGATRGGDGENAGHPCILEAGHEGEHRSIGGGAWSAGTPGTGTTLHRTPPAHLWADHLVAAPTPAEEIRAERPGALSDLMAENEALLDECDAILNRMLSAPKPEEPAPAAPVASPAPQMFAALAVMARSPHIHDWLAQNDPMALRQLKDAMLAYGAAYGSPACADEALLPWRPFAAV